MESWLNCCGRRLDAVGDESTGLVLASGVAFRLGLAGTPVSQAISDVLLRRRSVHSVGAGAFAVLLCS